MPQLGQSEGKSAVHRFSGQGAAQKKKEKGKRRADRDSDRGRTKVVGSGNPIEDSR